MMRSYLRVKAEMRFCIIIITLLSFCMQCGQSNNNQSNINTNHTKISDNNKSKKNTKSADEILTANWDNRNLYETKNRRIKFEDCGFSSKGSKQLSGALCKYTGSKWILEDPKIEPTDNLYINGSFDLANFSKKIASNDGEEIAGWELTISGESADPSGVEVKLVTNEFKSPPCALQFYSKDQEVNVSQNIKIIIPMKKEETDQHYFTIVYNIKRLSGKNPIRIGLGLNLGNSMDYSRMESMPSSQEFESFVLIKKVEEMNPGYPFLITYVAIDQGNSILIDDITLVRGKFPMGF